MKKGLFSILASTLLVVGCQNYDDQFSNIESQISALASTVAGLSQVQNDLQSLAGTVNSLQSSLSSQIDTALADGLADIDAAVVELNEAAAEAASAEDVAAIQASVDANAEDLEELLDASAVFTGDVTINSVATLDIFNGMGDAIAIVNGNVDIDATADMDAVKLQETIDNILTTVKDFSYVATTSTVPAMTFNNLTGTATLTLKQAGGYIAQGLVSAQNIYLYDDYKSKVDKIDFRALTSVQKFYTDTTADKIAFSKATELHLTELVRYPPLNLTIEVDEGAAFPNKLDDVDADGDQKDITLDITGPASLTFTNILDGTIKVKDVATVTINGFKGHVEILDGVETYTSDKAVTLDIDSADDLETLTVTGALDPDTATDKSGPAIVFEDNNSITTVTLSGKVGAVNFQGNGNLDTVTISAEVDGAVEIGAAGAGNGNSDLATVTLTGGKATAVHVIQNFDLETVTIDNAFIAGSATGAKLDGTIKVVDNTSLTNLNISSDKVENLTITGNDDLTTVDFTGLAAAGATGSPEVYIYDNDIEASFEDEDDTASTKTGDGEANDLGDVTSESGILTAYTYLAAVKGDADSKMSVFVDSVNFTTEGDTTSEVLWSAGTAVASQNTKLRIAYVVPNTADAGDGATFGKRSFLYDVGEAFVMYVNNTTVVSSGVTISSNLNTAVNDILTTAAVAAADAAGVTMTATAYASPRAFIQVASNSSLAENSATAASTGFAFSVSDTFAITIDGEKSTISKTSYATASALVTAWIAQWNDEHNDAANDGRWTLSQRAAVATDPLGDQGVVIIATADDKGSREIGASMAVAVGAGGTTATFTSVGYAIGNDQNFTKSTGDNIAQGSDVMVTLTADTAGDLLGEVGKYGAAYGTGAKAVSTTGTAVELSSTRRPNGVAASSAAETVTNQFSTESRLDVVIPEEANAAAASNATDFSRIGWLN